MRAAAAMLAVLSLAGCAANKRSALITIGGNSTEVVAQDGRRGVSDPVPVPDSFPVRIEAYGSDREPARGVRLRVEDVDEVRTELETGPDGTATVSLRYNVPSAFPLWEAMLQVTTAQGAVHQQWVPIVGPSAFYRHDGKSGYRTVVRVIPKPIRVKGGQ